MGQDLSMIVHICGMDRTNSEENIAQLELINSIFTEPNNGENTNNYTIRNSKKPKWNAIIYKQQKNFALVKKTIKDYIELAKKKK